VSSSASRSRMISAAGSWQGMAAPQLWDGAVGKSGASTA